ncbi:integral membrane [Fusarium albosuccineum]|uniref:Integral membrane n=1 Tax=Fusarium albosuccineum TaxID=1237068 RepID=A0A8H4P736_9HYPO|nr:integral membrane [Fusarium albosuccineum]
MSANSSTTLPPEALNYDEGSALVVISAVSIPFALATVAVRCLFLTEFVYGTVLCTIKAGILLMYYRIFPTRSMKIGGYVLGGLTLAWWIGIVFTSIFQCTPVNKAWEPFMEGGKCLDKNKFFIGNSIPNIVVDAMIISLPVFEVSKVQVPRSQKIAIAGIFLLGGLIVVISCIRLKYIVELLQAGPEADFTSESADPSQIEMISTPWVWTVVEPTIGLLCACLPTMQPLLYLLFGRFVTRATQDRSKEGIITIGGSGSKQMDRERVPAKDGPFRRLHDNDSAEEPVLWPETYHNQQNTVVEHLKGDTEDAIPLGTITVKKEMWTESR